MSSSRDIILGKLRAARKPFDDAPSRPGQYLPVIPLADTSKPAMIEQFINEMSALKGKAWLVQGDQGVRDIVLHLLRDHGVEQVLAWDFAHIPVAGLEDALHAAGISIVHPRLHDERSPEVMQQLNRAGAGISGADAAIAATGTLVLSSGEGKSRIATVLPPIWIAIITDDQLVPRLEDWLAGERQHTMQTILQRANLAFVTGPSRTGDIEMELILGVHGPGTEYVVIKQS